MLLVQINQYNIIIYSKSIFSLKKYIAQKNPQNQESTNTLKKFCENRLYKELCIFFLLIIFLVCSKMSTMIAIKSHFGEDVRRFSFPSKGSFDDLQVIISKLYGFEGSELLLQYVDDESDFVSISCTAELHEAISLCSSLLKLYISKRVVVMDENAPLFNSWVLVQSLVNSPPADVEPHECKKTLEQIETLSQKVQTCKDLLRLGSVCCLLVYKNV